MKSVGNTPEQPEERNTLKLPNRAAEEALARAVRGLHDVCRAMGIKPEEVDVAIRRGKNPGKGELVMRLPPELHDKAMRHFDVKLFDPENTTGTKVGGVEVELTAPSGEEQWLPVGDKPAPKRWAGDERQKRTTRKKDTPPDRA